MKFFIYVFFLVYASLLPAAEPVYKWVFSEKYVKGSSVTPVAGTLPLNLSGHKIEMTSDGLKFNKDKIILNKVFAPEDQITVAALVSVKSYGNYLAFASYFQDNGNYEKGWLLGVRKNCFIFQVALHGKLQILKSEPFRLNEFYMVVGVYDGRKMSLFVNGKMVASQKQQGKIQYPPKAFFCIGSYKDDNEDFPLNGYLKSIALYDTALTEKEIKLLKGWGGAADLDLSKLITDRPDRYYEVPDKNRLVFSNTPNAVYTSRTKARLEWGSPSQGKYTVLLRMGKKVVQIKNIKKNGSNYSAILPVVGKGIYNYTIVCRNGDKLYYSPSFELDVRLNFLPFSYNELNSGKHVAESAPPAFMKSIPVKTGYCLIPDIKSAALAVDIVKYSRFKVLGVTTDSEVYQKLQDLFYSENILGTRVALYLIKKGEKYPFISNSMNLILLNSKNQKLSRHDIGECERVLVPGKRGFLLLNRSTSANYAKFIQNSRGITLKKESDDLCFQKKQRPDSGSWTHQYGTPANIASSSEKFGNVTKTSDLQVNWFGNPGADFGMDRNSRMPAPLGLDGRLFHQGLNRFVALDSYNGSIIWEIELPYLRRLNMIRDASNWCLDATGLYVTVNNSLMKFNPETGHIIYTVKLPVENPDSYDWGYIAASDSRLYGSAVLKGGVYKDFWGGRNWYDNNKGGYGTEKVCSRELFSISPADGKKIWSYSADAIINTSIVIIGDKIVFIEAETDKGEGRMTDKELGNELFLVSLNKKSGEVIRKNKISIVLGNIATYMQAAENRIVITTSDSAKKQYYIYGFDMNLKEVWEQSFRWPRGDHSGYQQHPVIVGSKLLLMPNIFDLKDGQLISSKVPINGGCATYVGSRDLIFFRGKNRQIAIWDSKTNNYSTITKLRPSCWLSIIPANGMFLVPEGGGGCSCGGWLEASFGFAVKESGDK